MSPDETELITHAFRVYSYLEYVITSQAKLEKSWN